MKKSILDLGLPARLTPRIVTKNDISIWTESFGRVSDPAVLLVQGSGGQTVMWPQDFCEDLANHGFYVIRYDHRDAGLSSTVDFEEKPYNFLDMANDAIAILDDYDLKRAHLIGYSIGGLISTLAASHYPERILSLTLMSSTLDMRSNLDAFLGRETKSRLSPPSDEFLDWGTSYLTAPPKTMNEKLKKFIQGARIQHGPLQPFDEAWYEQLARQTQLRQRCAASIVNHVKAVEPSYKLYSKAFKNLKIAPLIIHGQIDPVLPIDHAKALKAQLSDAKLVIFPEMGHGLNKGMHKKALTEIVTYLREAFC